MSQDKPTQNKPEAKRPPPSMWTAPQSLMYPTAPQRRKPFDSKRADVYFRRVTHPHNPEGPPPAMWQRYSLLAGGAISAMMGIYLVVWADYKQEDHIFKGIRRALKVEAINPFALSSEEKLWLEKKRDSSIQADTKKHKV